MTGRKEGAYSREICDRRATKPATPPRRKTDRNIFKTRSKPNRRHAKQILKHKPNPGSTKFPTKGLIGKHAPRISPTSSAIRPRYLGVYPQSCFNPELFYTPFE